MGIHSTRRLLAPVIAAAALIATTPATAQVFTGDTTGSPTFNRPVENGDLPPTSLSGAGTAVPYDTLTFTVDTTGSYSFLLESVFDNYLGLYEGSFDPSSPLTNALEYDDDGAPAVNFDAFIERALTSGTVYTSVVTGFSNSSFGAYSLTIRGDGLATPVGDVPEPATWAMMLIGFGAIGLSLRFRRPAAGTQAA
jgi:hypothetical protein